MSVYELNGLRIIDLSKIVDPSTETRVCNVERYWVEGNVPDYNSIATINSHLGTHVECPYHHHNDWSDVTDLPITNFMGRAIYLNFSDKKPLSYITRGDLEKQSAGRIKEGDIVILDSPYKLDPFTEKTNTPEDQRLLINGETAQWLLEKKVKSIGFGDGVSVENANDDVKPFHDILMEHDVTFLEVLKNLEQLRQEIFFITFTPLPIKTLDASPVRAVAIEGLEKFS